MSANSRGALKLEHLDAGISEQMLPRFAHFNQPTSALYTSASKKQMTKMGYGSTPGCLRASGEKEL